MAAAMAAKINAMLMAKGKLLTPPPLLAKVHVIQTVGNNKFIFALLFYQLFHVIARVLQTAPNVPVPSATEEMAVTEVDINNVPLNCRDLLTKGKTQEEVSGQWPWQSCNLAALNGFK